MFYGSFSVEITLNACMLVQMRPRRLGSHGQDLKEGCSACRLPWP